MLIINTVVEKSQDRPGIGLMLVKLLAFLFFQDFDANRYNWLQMQ